MHNEIEILFLKIIQGEISWIFLYYFRNNDFPLIYELHIELVKSTSLLLHTLIQFAFSSHLYQILMLMKQYAKNGIVSKTIDFINESIKQPKYFTNELLPETG